MSTELAEMILDVSPLRFLLLMENVKFLTTLSIRSTLRDQMEREEIGTQLGLVWQYKIQLRSFMTASGGIQKKNSFGLTKDQFRNLNKVFESTRHM